MSNEEQDLIEKFIQKTGGFAKDMTLRDYFAAKAMQGWLSTYPDDFPAEAADLEGLSKWAYEAADAMLKASRA